MEPSKQPVMIKGLSARIPYYGSKRQVTQRIWERLGDPVVYAEPFAGSLAVLLGRPPTNNKHTREIICDTDHLIVNFFRSVQYAPETVAKYAKWPIYHADLSARRKTLIQWRDNQKNKIIDDPEHHDPKMAGWWLWCLRNWIGSSFSSIPKISGIGQRPHIGHNSVAHDIFQTTPSLDHIKQLSERLRNVIVLGSDWTQCLGDTPLMHTRTSPKPTVGILLDPPYLTKNRSKALYHNDKMDDVAHKSYKWAIDNGHRYRIAYCAHNDDFNTPDEWTTITKTFSGIKRQDRRDRKDIIMFSPTCIPPIGE